MQTLAMDVTKRIGFVDASDIEPWLEKVVLIDKENQYDFSLELEPDLGVYATMVVMLGSKGQVGLWSIAELVAVLLGRRNASVLPCTCRKCALPNLPLPAVARQTILDEIPHRFLIAPRVLLYTTSVCTA